MRQILGTGEASTKKNDGKPSTSNQLDQYDYTKEALDEMVYRDSSTFLKVSRYYQMSMKKCNEI